MHTQPARVLIITLAATFALSVLALIGIPFTSSAAPASSSGLGYYVNPNGNDSNDGRSTGGSFKSIQKAIDAAQPGDTINLAAGVYMQDVLTKHNGTPNAPITITGPAAAIIQGGGNGRIFEVNHDYLVLDGFTIDGQYSANAYRDKLLYVHGIEARDGVTGLKIQHVILRNAGGECLRLRYFVQHSEISNNTIGPCGRDDFPNGVYGGGHKNGEGIYVGTAPEQRADGKNPTADPDLTTDNWIHNNTINTQGNECVDIKESATRNLVEHNNCTGQKDPDSGGFDARGNGNTFRYNEDYGNVGVGVRLGGDTPSDGIDNDVYANNIHDNNSGGIKFQRAPQRQLCGNTMSGNTGGDSVGDFGAQFKPASTCSSVPASEPSSTPNPSPTSTAKPSATATAQPSATATAKPSTTATATVIASPVASATATTQPPQGQTTYAPVADTSINSSSSSNYGNKSSLKADTTPETWALIRFQLPAGQPVTRAQLRLYVKDGSPQGGRISITTSGWDEQTTWNKRPPLGASVTDIGTANKGKYITVDVTSALQPDGTLALAILPQSKDAVVYASREDDQGKRPQLIVQR